MPSVSRHQHAFMAMSQTPFGRAALEKHGHDPAPVEVANEFMKADNGHSFPAYGKHKDDWVPPAVKMRAGTQQEGNELTPRLTDGQD